MCVGLDPGLGPGIGPRRHAQLVHRHRQQRHRDAFPSRKQHIHLAVRGIRGDSLGQVQQVIRGVTHGGDHHNYVVTCFLSFHDALCDALHSCGIRYRRSAIFLYYKGHVSPSLWVSMLSLLSVRRISDAGTYGVAGLDAPYRL